MLITKRLTACDKYYSQCQCVPSVSGRGAGRYPQEARGSSQHLAPKGHYKAAQFPSSVLISVTSHIYHYRTCKYKNIVLILCYIYSVSV